MKETIRMYKENEELTLRQAFDKFICEKKALQVAPDTIRSYTRVFKSFTDFSPDNSLCSEISSATIFQFVEFVQARNPHIKTVTINMYLRHMRGFFYHCMNAGYVKRFDIKMLRYEKEIKETYSAFELEQLLKKPNVKKCSFAQYRNWVLVCYLLGTGNRLGTVCNLQIKDIDFANHEIVLRKVKNKKQYIIPLAPTLEKTLAEYLQYRKGDGDDYLFCTPHGEKMKKDTLTSAISRYNLSHGVTKTSIHLFRHTFAKNWILNGGDIFRLKSILGHSSLEIVKEYVNMFGGDLQKDFDKFNPLEQMKATVAGREGIKMTKRAN